MLLLTITLGLAVRVFSKNSNRANSPEPEPFPWQHPPCDVASLLPEHFDTAFAIEKSIGGSMGGVFFMALEPNAQPCILVAKPKVDLHDIFANTLAAELGAPVVPSKAVKKSDPLFQATLDGIKAGMLKKFGPEAEEVATHLVNEFLESAGGQATDGYIQLMAKAVGKDPYGHLKGLQYEACEACKDEAIDEIWAKKAVDEIEAKIKAFENKVKNGHSFNMLEKPTIEKAIGKNLLEELEEADQDRKNEIAQKLREAMLEQRSNKSSPLRKIDIKIEKDKKRAKENKEHCVGRNGGMKQDQAEVEERIEYVRKSFQNNVQLVAALTAFVSLVGEYDSLPAPGFGTPMSNMMNVMVSPTSIEGIDIAVGGATSHLDIRQDGSNGPPSQDMKTFFLRQSARQGFCKNPSGIDPEEVDMAEEAMRFRVSMPFFSGPDHMYAKQCHIEQGRIFKEEEINPFARNVMQEISQSFRDYLGKMHRAVAMTAARLSGFGTPEDLMNIVGWLLHRVDSYQKDLDEADAICPHGLPASPIVSENHGSSLNGQEPPIPPADGKDPPMPPAFNKHSKKMGYVWHTVETMWKKGQGQWFGTRTTDIVAVPLKPAQ